MATPFHLEFLWTTQLRMFSSQKCDTRPHRLWLWVTLKYLLILCGFIRTVTFRLVSKQLPLVTTYFLHVSPHVSIWHIAMSPVKSTLGRQLRRLGSIQWKDGVFRELFLACFFWFAPWLWKQVQVFRNWAGTPCSWHGTYNLQAKKGGEELEWSSQGSPSGPSLISLLLLTFVVSIYGSSQ